MLFYSNWVPSPHTLLQLCATSHSQPQHASIHTYIVCGWQFGIGTLCGHCACACRCSSVSWEPAQYKYSCAHAKWNAATPHHSTPLTTKVKRYAGMCVCVIASVGKAVKMATLCMLIAYRNTFTLLLLLHYTLCPHFSIFPFMHSVTF